ncbi:MAG: hypothetical protein AAFR54_23135, partial [Planctomycetota bacterium]
VDESFRYGMENWNELDQLEVGRRIDEASKRGRSRFRAAEERAYAQHVAPEFPRPLEGLYRVGDVFVSAFVSAEHAGQVRGRALSRLDALNGIFLTQAHATMDDGAVDELADAIHRWSESSVGNGQYCDVDALVYEAAQSRVFSEASHQEGRAVANAILDAIRSMEQRADGRAIDAVAAAKVVFIWKHCNNLGYARRPADPNDDLAVRVERMNADDARRSLDDIDVMLSRPVEDLTWSELKEVEDRIGELWQNLPEPLVNQVWRRYVDLSQVRSAAFLREVNALGVADTAGQMRFQSWPTTIRDWYGGAE